MNIYDILFNLIFFLVVFLIVFLISFHFICRSRSTKDKKTKKRIKGTDKLTTEGMYLISRFNLDDKLVNLHMMNFYISIITAFIISFVATTVSLIKVNVVVQLLIGFVLLFALIYAIYEIYG